jgi:hypothetical protein
MRSEIRACGQKSQLSIYKPVMRNVIQ